MELGRIGPHQCFGEFNIQKNSRAKRKCSVVTLVRSNVYCLSKHDCRAALGENALAEMRDAFSLRGDIYGDSDEQIK